MKWEKIKDKLVYKGYRTIIKRYFKLPNGNIKDFDIKIEGPVVCMLGLTPEKKVILFKQFRPGPQKILMELPGGAIEKGEKISKAAEREFLEETGYNGNFQFVGKSLSCGYSDMVRNNFVVTDCKKVSEPNLDENEFGEVVKVSISEFRNLLRKGELVDVETGYLGLDYLNLL